MADTLEALGVDYRVGGSVASSALGVGRSTFAIDLEWYRLGNRVSQRPWEDVRGVFRVQGDALDRAYLERWPRELGIDDLLARARTEARQP